MKYYIWLDPKDMPTAQQKGVCIRGGKPRFYEKKKVRDARDVLVLAFEALGVERHLTCKCYSVRAEFVYKLDSTPKKLFGKPKETRPDLDNLNKLLLDAITDSKVAWKDDRQVTCLMTKKRHADIGEEAHIEVDIEEDVD